MRIDLENIIKFISGVKSLAGNSGILGIVLEVVDNNLRLVYSDGKKALYSSFVADIDEREKELGTLVLEYNTLINGLSQVQSSSSSIKVPEIELDFDSLSDNLIKVKSNKYMTFIDGDKTNDSLISTSEFFIKAYKKEEAPSKYSILTRFNYQDMIFKHTDYDTWQTKSIVNILKKLSKGDDNKSAYISSKYKAGFIVNRSSLYYIFNDTDISFGFSATKQVIKGLLDIISKYSPDSLNIATEDVRYCSIFNENFGIWFEMVKAKSVELQMLGEYQDNSDTSESRQYNDIEILLNREATLDMVKASQVGHKNDSDILNIDYSDCNLIFGDAKKGKSKLGVQLRSSLDKPKSTLCIVYKVWEDILNNCDGSYVKLGIELKDDRTVYLRFSDLDNEDTTLVNGVYYSIATERQ